MPKLFLLRHIKSQWNTEDRFTGWVDVPLDKKAIKTAKALSRKIFAFDMARRFAPLARPPAAMAVAFDDLATSRSLKGDLGIDVIYSSPLFRNVDTVFRILEKTDKYPLFIHLAPGKMKEWANFKRLKKENYIPVYVSEKLNERYYGKLQGQNKKEIMKKYGFRKVRLWRRSYDIAPPGGESLIDVVKRTIPFYKRYVAKNLKQGKNVLIVASHNSLRAIVKYLEKISDEKVIDLEIPYAGLIEYKLDKFLRIKNKKQL